jgi:hypothetical protein
MFATAWVADKYRIRGPIIAANAMVTIIGLAMMGWAPGIPAQYAGVFFTCAGANSNIPHMMSWQANNIRGQWKRAFCSATLVAFGGIGGIAGSLVFRFVFSSKSVRGALRRGRNLLVMLKLFLLLTDLCCRQQDAPGYKPGLWACMTGSLIIIIIVAVTDIHFYFANKKQAQGLKIIEPVDGVDSSVSLLLLLLCTIFGKLRPTDRLLQDKFRYTY